MMEWSERETSLPPTARRSFGCYRRDGTAAASNGLRVSGWKPARAETVCRLRSRQPARTPTKTRIGSVTAKFQQKVMFIGPRSSQSSADRSRSAAACRTGDSPQRLSPLFFGITCNAPIYNVKLNGCGKDVKSTIFRAETKFRQSRAAAPQVQQQGLLAGEGLPGFWRGLTADTVLASGLLSARLRHL